MQNNTSVEKVEDGLAIPVAAVLCLAMSFYLIVVLIGLLIRKCLIAHGYCKNYSPKLGFSRCCSCASCVQTCDCKLPTVDGCLDTICPAKQRINCIEFLVCDWASMQCCNEGGTYTCCMLSAIISCYSKNMQIFCLSCEIYFCRDVSLFLQCGSGDYSCTCEAPQCDSINCLCCEISFRNVSTAQ